MEENRNGVTMDNQMNQYDNGGGYNNGGRGNVPGGNGGNGNQPPRKPNITMLVLAALSTVLIVFMLWNIVFGGAAAGPEVSYTQFCNILTKEKWKLWKCRARGRSSLL